MVRRFCPKCGKTFSPKEKYYENFLCSNCYVHNTKEFTLPSSITLNSCQFCNSFSVTVDGVVSQWDIFRPKEEELFDFIADLIYRRVLKRIEKEAEINLGLDMEESDLDFSMCKTFKINVLSGCTDNLEGPSKPLTVYVKKIYCNTCAAKKGGRFESVIQVRYMDEKDHDRLQILLDELSKYEEYMAETHPEYFVARVDNVTNGFDLKLSTKQYAKHLVSWIREKYPMILTVSKKLMGVNKSDGSDLYRVYFNLTLLPVQPGSIIEFGELRYVVIAISKNDVKFKKQGTDKIIKEKLDWFSKKKFRTVEDEVKGDDENGEE